MLYRIEAYLKKTPPSTSPAGEGAKTSYLSVIAG
jgi:hypothetical protein